MITINLKVLVSKFPPSVSWHRQEKCDENLKGNLPSASLARLMVGGFEASDGIMFFPFLHQFHANLAFRAFFSE
jgi:hypothetical protein